MTRQSIQAFRQELSKNKALQTKVQAINRRDKEAALKQLVGVGAAAGFTFTAEEARALIKPKARELSVSDLDQISGGGEEGFIWDWGGNDIVGQH